jgi:hypothetical protein
MGKICGNAAAAFLLVVIGFSSITSAAADSATLGKIGASSVWQVPQQFITDAHAACDKVIRLGRC